MTLRWRERHGATIGGPAAGAQLAYRARRRRAGRSPSAGSCSAPCASSATSSTWQRHRAALRRPRRSRWPRSDRLLAAARHDSTAGERARHLALLGAPERRGARGARLRPHDHDARPPAVAWTARVVQPSLDGRDTLCSRCRADPRRVDATRAPATRCCCAPARGGAVPFTVRIATTGRAAHAARRAREIFTPAFLAFLDARERARGPADGPRRRRWLERQVRGVELLASREKLMAGLPTYATYFGRDMLVTRAHDARPSGAPRCPSSSIASALRKLSPDGRGEPRGGARRPGGARGGGGVRRRSSTAHRRATRAGAPPRRLAARPRHARCCASTRRVRENYHMIDDEFQLPVLAGALARRPGRAGGAQARLPPRRDDGRRAARRRACCASSRSSRA